MTACYTNTLSACRLFGQLVNAHLSSDKLKSRLLIANTLRACYTNTFRACRLFGQLVNAHLSSDNLVYSGAYALAGTAAMLGGVQ